MSDLTCFSPASDAFAPAAVVSAALAEAAGAPQCDECLGSGGWYRYEPAMDAPGRLYLSCMHCRGSGWLALGAA